MWTTNCYTQGGMCMKLHETADFAPWDSGGFQIKSPWRFSARDDKLSPVQAVANGCTTKRITAHHGSWFPGLDFLTSQCKWLKWLVRKSWSIFGHQKINPLLVMVIFHVAIHGKPHEMPAGPAALPILILLKGAFQLHLGRWSVQQVWHLFLETTKMTHGILELNWFRKSPLHANYRFYDSMKYMIEIGYTKYTKIFYLSIYLSIHPSNLA